MADPQTLEFRTDLQQLLQILVHSLYTEREIFLRELISNASDAIDKARFEALQHPDDFADQDWSIRVVPDERAGTLTISDNGIGLSREDAVENLGTLARSGTREFLGALQEADAAERPRLIGQFGVGFYSAFMVADRVEVVSRKAGADEAISWESDGQGEFSVGDAQREARGTDVVLHLKEDAKEFLAPFRLRSTIKRWSDFVEHPITLVDDPHKDEEGEVVNSRQALWLRSPSEVAEEDYHAFHRQLSGDEEPPARTIHLHAEGTLEYRALLFVPARRPVDLFWHDREHGPSLYVQRVFIEENCAELLPSWLRFVRGVVDSSDLPLNVSRESLQHDPRLAQIRRGLVNKVLNVLEEMLADDRDAYAKLWGEFGPVLKEGLHTDARQRERLQGLCLLDTTKGERRSFAEIVADLPEGSETIWWISGPDRAQLAASPAIEHLVADGHEVLLLHDPVDEFWVASVGEVEGKQLRPADREGAHEGDGPSEATKERYAGLLGDLQGWLEGVAELRLGARLRGSAACLLDADGEPGPQLRRMMEQMGRGDELPPRRRILELNPEHAAVRALLERHEAGGDRERLAEDGKLLLDQALLAAGEPLPDPAATARRIARLLAGGGDGAKEGTAG